MITTEIKNGQVVVYVDGYVVGVIDEEGEVR